MYMEYYKTTCSRVFGVYFRLNTPLSSIPNVVTPFKSSAIFEEPSVESIGDIILITERAADLGAVPA